MADDGILMNFATDLAPFQPKPVFRGGRWKDRLHAKKSLRRKDHPKTPPPSNLTGSNTQTAAKVRQLGQDKEDEKRPEKKQKTSSNDDAPKQTTRPKQSNASKSKDGGSGEIISSIFTSKPSSNTSLKPPPPSDAPPLPPSNAPLPPHLHNFTTLGLSLPLSTHLTTTFSLTAPTAIQKAALFHLIHNNTDAFLQAETGSGKTLAYLLPIVQHILSLKPQLGSNPHHDPTQLAPTSLNRSSGLFALILAPTRELVHQIHSVLTRLLSKHPHLVASAITGGSTKNHEKARLRKGVNILVATPGRLADHLENTAVLELGRVRWLVLDEGDRMMEMGFEEEVRKVVEAIDGGVKEKEKENGAKEREGEVEGLPEKRTTILCSATMKRGAQRLGEMSLKDAVLLKVDDDTTTRPSTTADPTSPTPRDTTTTPIPTPPVAPFRPPTQLSQSYILTPPKQRLVTLTALLHTTFHPPSPTTTTPPRKALLFLSCADSVDYHSLLLSTHLLPVPVPSTYANPTIHHLHGSLPPPTRSTNLQSFISAPPPALLLTTDVSARGLDLPDVDLVIEYDPAFSMDEHLHRVGRTARAGRGGGGVVFLIPSEGMGEGEGKEGKGGKEGKEGKEGEEGYVDMLKEVAGDGVVTGEDSEAILKRGFTPAPAPAPASGAGGSGASAPGWQQRATDWQLAVERWVLSDEKVGEMARKAYKSHVRAYATHVARERGVFDVGRLQLGWVAKGFGLRERPGAMGRGETGKRRGAGRRGGKEKRGGEGKIRKGANGKRRGDGGEEKGREEVVVADAGKKMRDVVRAQRTTGGVEEFNIG